jgi:formate-dependent nitrite reductase membrane component NrfD
VNDELRTRERVKEIDDPRDPFSQITPSYDILKAAAPQGVREQGYYGLPILKRPFWKWEIALYFFFEGISAGSYVLCTTASLRDPERFDSTIRTGRVLSFLTMLLCPPLLIADLGRPERFHHMLRIFKRTSPMNHGAWALSGYGMFASVLALLTVTAPRLRVGAAELGLLQRLLPQRLLGVLGMPFALTMVSYPGVLLSTTANPLWSHTHFLGALFACSSMSNGGAALTLCNYRAADESVHHSLDRFEDVAAVAEAGAMALYFGTARKAARPLLRGKQSRVFLVGAVAIGLIAPAFLRRSKSPLLRSGLAPLLTLAGGLALKWSITYAGQESALDAELASHNAPTKSGQPFWGPKKA